MDMQKRPDPAELLVLDALIAAAHAAASHVQQPTLRAVVTVLTCVRDGKYALAAKAVRELAETMGEPQ